MKRAMLVVTTLSLAVFGVPAVAIAADEEPREYNKSISEWIEILEQTKDLARYRLALHALGSAGDHPVVWRELTQKRRKAMFIIDLIGPARSKKAMPAMATALRNDPDEALRAMAAQSLGGMSKKCKNQLQDFSPGRDALYSALRTDPSGPVRKAAAAALGTLDPEDIQPAVSTLMERLKDPYGPVRPAAADTLRRLGKEAAVAVPALIEAVADPANETLTRYQCVLALQNIGPPEAVPALATFKKILTDEKAPEDVRMAIAIAVSAFGKDASDMVPILGKLLVAPTSTTDLRGKITEALVKLGPDAKGAIGDLKKAATTDQDKFVRTMSVRALGAIGKELGPEVKEVVTILVKEARENILLDVRLAAIETLGNLGTDVLGDQTAAVKKALMELTQTGEKESRQAATNALLKLEGKEPPPE